jgi:hypothetical protein
MTDRSSCASCNRTIDAWAKLCPYCGANPQTGERMDTQAILQEVFKPREVTTSASVLEYARQRQGAVIAIAAFVVFLLMAALHQFATMRNATAVTDSPAVPLSELTDITNKPDDAAPVPLPELNFEYGGRPATMRTYIIERGAITPPEVVAAQQAAAAAAAPKPAVATPGAAGPAPAGAAPAPAGARPPVPATPQQGAPARPQPARPQPR